MPQQKKVSVILTSYNHEGYLRQAIDSVLNQTYPDFDLLIWDDGSTDKSWEIINSYSDPRIRAFKNTTGQRGAPIRTVVSEVTTGEFIAIHHSDDVWEPEKLEKQIDFLEQNHQIGAVFSNVSIIGENGEPFNDTSHFYYNIFNQPNRSRYEWLNFFFYNSNALCHSSILIRKVCYDDCGLYRYGLAQLADFDMWVRLCLKYDIYVLPEKLVQFRVRLNDMNASGNHLDGRIRWQFESIQVYENYRDIKDPEEFIKVFPNAKVYFTQDGVDISFALGMICLEPRTFNIIKLLGLKLLFEVLNDPARARKIDELYHFGNADFVALTAKHDVFSMEFIARWAKREQTLREFSIWQQKTSEIISAQLVEQEKTLLQTQAKMIQIQDQMAHKELELDEIKNSKAWKLIQFFRSIRSWIFPPRNPAQVPALGENKTSQNQQQNEKREDFVSDDSFDPFFYLYYYPDIKISGIDPYQHFKQFGKYEGRLGSHPKLNVQKGLAGFEPLRETILIVSHQASRTGAPILSLNLVQNLQKKYNVISLFFSEGSITKYFHAASAFVVGPVESGTKVYFDSVIKQLAEMYNFKFAIVNSIESRGVLPALAKRFIPTISLVHEFATYTRPRQDFLDAILWADETIFSTSMTYENALSEYPELRDHSFHIIPQGLCNIPSQDDATTSSAQEEDKVLNIMRPTGLPANTIVILGVGAVHMRKGVDLFIDCATRVMQSGYGDNYRFVWIGNGFDAENDMGYSIYLLEQVRRAGLQQYVFFMEETSNIETAYKAADIFLLASRLDPLPNVAIDAMIHKLPLICFEKTTGIANILIANNLGEECVAPYIDTVKASDKIIRFAQSKSLRHSIGERLHQVALKEFDMDNYVSRLEQIGLATSDVINQEGIDILEIIKSELVRLDFFLPPNSNMLADEAVHYYVRMWANHIVRRRKLFPGFHPGIFAEQQNLHPSEGDPLTNYLRAGQPAGPWRHDVISSEETAQPLPNHLRIALHLHIDSSDLLPEILERLNRNQAKPELLVSVPTDLVRDEVQNILSQTYSGSTVEIRVVPGYEHELKQFLTVFGATIMGGYDLVGHIHTNKNKKIRQDLYTFLLENLLGGKSTMTDSILGHLATDTSIGLVFPDNPNVEEEWGSDKAYAQNLGQRFGIDNLPENFLFPVEAMFWARVECLLPIFKFDLKGKEFPSELSTYDGSTMYAIERLLPLIISKHGFRSVLTNVAGFKVS